MKPRVYDSSMKVKRILSQASKISYTKKRNDLYTGSFELPWNGGADALGMHEVVELYDGSMSVGKYRVVSMPNLDITVGEVSKASYSLEHVIAFLMNDNVHNEYIISEGTTIRSALQSILDMQSVRRWNLGICDFGSTLAEIKLDGENLLDAFMSILKHVREKYVITFNTNSYPWTVNVEPPKLLTEYVPLRFGHEINKISVDEDYHTLFTRLYCYGDEITIAEANNGLDYIDASTISERGIICGKFKDSTETNPYSLLRKAQQRLEDVKNPRRNYKINIVDYYRKTRDARFLTDIGFTVRIIAPRDNIDVVYYVVEQSKEDVDGDPLNMNLTVNDGKGDLADDITRLSQSIQNTDRDLQSSKSAGRSSVRETASVIRSELWGVDSKYGSAITQTASMIRSEVWAMDSQRYSQITQTAESIRSEVHALDSKMGSSITQTASYIRSEVYAVDSARYSQIVQTASSIRSEVKSVDSKLSSEIVQTACSIRLSVSSATSHASIVAAINDNTSSVKIKADKIELDGYVTATNLKTEIGKIETLEAQAIIADSVSVKVASNKYAGFAGLYNNAIKNIRVSGPTNNEYKLQAQYFLNDGWYDLPNSTFSRATTLSGAWSGSSSNSSATVTVTASPQGNSESYTVYLDPDDDSDDNIFHVELYKNSVSSSNYLMGKSVYLTLSASSKLVYARWGSRNGTAYANIDVSEVYRNGVNSVTVSNSDIVRETSDYYNSSTHNTTIYIEATASNGQYGTQSFTVSGSNAYNDGKKDVGVYITESGSWYSSWTIYAGEEVTFYPAKWINNAYDIDTSRGLTVTAITPSLSFSYANSYISGRFRVNMDGQDSGLYAYLEYANGYVYVASDGYRYARLYVADLFSDE